MNPPPTIEIHIITPDLDQILASLDRVPLHLDSHEAWCDFRTRVYSLRERLRWLASHASWQHTRLRVVRVADPRQREFAFAALSSQRRFGRSVLDTRKAA